MTHHKVGLNVWPFLGSKVLATDFVQTFGGGVIRGITNASNLENECI